VRAGAPPAVTPDDGIAAMAAAEALVRAARTGEHVLLSEGRLP
jgi:predicted dehydrogenase